MGRSAFLPCKTLRVAEKAEPIGQIAAAIFGFLPVSDSPHLARTATLTIFGSSPLQPENGPGRVETSRSRPARRTAPVRRRIRHPIQVSTAPSALPPQPIFPAAATGFKAGSIRPEAFGSLEDTERMQTAAWVIQRGHLGRINPPRAFLTHSCDSGDLACRRNLHNIPICNRNRRNSGRPHLLHYGWRHCADRQLDTVQRPNYGFSHRDYPGDRVGAQLPE